MPHPLSEAHIRSRGLCGIRFENQSRAELTDASKVTRMTGRVRRCLVENTAPAARTSGTAVCSLLNPYLETPKSRVLGLRYNSDLSAYLDPTDPVQPDTHNQRSAASGTFSATMDSKRRRLSEELAVTSMHASSTVDHLTDRVSFGLGPPGDRRQPWSPDLRRDGSSLDYQQLENLRIS